MSRTLGGGTKRVKDVQCFDAPGHFDEHNFYINNVHSYGVVWEKGRWVSRR